MKKIISNEGLLYGHYEASFLTEAINERVSNRLEYYYNSCSRNGDVTAAGVLSYDLFDGVVTAITLTYAINDPTPQRLRDFRATCDSVPRAIRSSNSRASSSITTRTIPTCSSMPPTCTTWPCSSMPSNICRSV